MAYDELPRHHIVLPEVKLWQPDPRLAEIAIEGMKMRNEAIMHAMDTMTHYADPMTIAQRKLAILNADFEAKAMPYKQQELGYQTQLLAAQAKWMRDHPDEPFMPKSYSDLNAARTFHMNQTFDSRRNGALTPPSGDTSRKTPDYKLNQYRSGLGTGMQLGHTGDAAAAAAQSERDLENWGPPPFDLNAAPATAPPPATTGTTAATDPNNPPAADLNTGGGDTVGPSSGVIPYDNP